MSALKTDELRALAEAVKEWNSTDVWPHEDCQYTAVIGDIDEDGVQYPIAEINADTYGHDGESLALANFYAAANPAVVLGMLDRIAELEAQLYAIGAGGVEPLRKREYPVDTGNPEADRIIGRLASSDPDFDDCADAVALIHKLMVEHRGPDGFATWKDAAIAYRAARAATPAAAPVVLPEPVAAQSRFIDTPSDTWDSCSVEHARSFGGTGYEVRYLYTEQQVRALLATATGLPAQAARTWRGGNMTVADLVNNLLMMDQSLPIYGAQYIEHPAGRRRAIAVPPTVSIERVKDSRWIGEGEALNTAIIWTLAEQPAAPQQVQAAAQNALEEAASVLNSINKEASHEVQVGDEVCYWQRKEWIDWAEKEVLPKVRAAIAAAQRAAAQKDE